MIKCEVSQQGLWYTLSHKNEQVNHVFRIGSTSKDGMTIYEFIIWKLRIAWVYGI